MPQEYEDIIEKCFEDLETVRVDGKRPPLRQFYDAIAELESRARSRYRAGLEMGEIDA